MIPEKRTIKNEIVQGYITVIIQTPLYVVTHTGVHPSLFPDYVWLLFLYYGGQQLCC